MNPRFSASFSTLLSLGCLAIAGAVGTATANPLPIGGAIPSAPGAGPVGGVLLANTGPVPFTAATFSGVLTSKVIVNDPANPFGPGNLTFTYQFTSTAGPDSINRMTIDGYGVPGLLTDASFQAPVPPGDIIPTSFDRSSAGTLGNTIGASFEPVGLGLGDVPPGATTALIVIQTNTSIFNVNGADFIDGSVVGNVMTYAPFPGGGSTPEPASLTLLGLGAASLLARRKKA